MPLQRPFGQIAGAALLATLAVCPVATTAQDRAASTKVTYTGSLVGTTSGTTAPFTLTIDRMTPREELLRLAGLARSKGQDGLLDALDDADLGDFTVSGQLARDVRLAYVKDTPEGRRLAIVMERWIEPFEVRRGTRSRDYPFSYMEISLDKDDSGRGTFFGAARLEFDEEDPDLIDVERFGVYPATIIGLKRTR